VVDVDGPEDADDGEIVVRFVRVGHRRVRATRAARCARDRAVSTPCTTYTTCRV
jgi:hypothetical protein